MQNLAYKGLPKNPCDLWAYLSIEKKKYSAIGVVNNKAGNNEIHEWTCMFGERKNGEIEALAIKDILNRGKGSLQIVTDSKYIQSILTGSRKARDAIELWDEVDTLLKGREVYIHFTPSIESAKELFEKRTDGCEQKDNQVIGEWRSG